MTADTTAPIPGLTLADDLTPDEFRELCEVAGWGAPEPEQARLVIARRPVTLVARDGSGRAIGMAGIGGDGVMHAYVEDVVVRPGWRGRHVGAWLVRAALPEGWECTIDLRATRRAVGLYRALGYDAMPDDRRGPGMEKMVVG